MRRIPVRIMNQAVEVYETVKDDWGSTTDTFLCRVTRVRVEPVRRQNLNGDEKAAYTAKLFYDPLTSQPSNLSFELGMTIKHGSKRYRVKEVQPYHDEVGLHHVEVMLGG